MSAKREQPNAHLKAANWLLLVAVFLAPAITSAQPGSMDAFWSRQMDGLRRALGSTSLNSRVHNIWSQLVQYSGAMLPVVPAQQFTLGQALPNGVVLLDVSVAGDASVEVTAFTLAHEFGHQVLGHPRLLLTAYGQWLAANGGTSQEDAADHYAGRFLRSAGYRIEPVLEFLCELPGGGAGDAHSDGSTRAATVAEAYEWSAEPCDRRARDVVTHEVSIRIWSRYEGNGAEMVVSIDGELVGGLTNIGGAEELDVELGEGSHTFTMSDVRLYGPIGMLAGGLECSTTFTVDRARRFDLAALLLPNGEVRCALR